MSDNIPEDILIEILLKVPAKSLIRSTSVCKAWQSLIRSPSFISLHLSNTESQILLCDCNNQRYALVPKREPFSVKVIDTTLKCPIKKKEYYRIVGSCDGLMCFSETMRFFKDPWPPVIVVWNPTIRKQVVLPQSFTINVKEAYCVVLGFGVASNVYKVVRLVFYRKRRREPPRAEIFTLGTGMWRNLGAAGIIHARVSVGQGHSTFFNGFLHWIVVKKSTNGNEYYSILTFDVGDEVFGEIVLPEDLKMDILSTLIIGESFGAISNILEMGRLLYDVWMVWMMEDYGVKESWTKLYRIDFDGIERVIGFFENSELLLSINKYLFIYNAKTNEIKPTWYDFKESLLLLGYSEEESREESSLGATSTIPR